MRHGNLFGPVCNKVADIPFTRKHYPRKETAQDPQFFKRAYKDIRRFMEANGFERRQYSVYVSHRSYPFFLVGALPDVSRLL